MIKAEFCRLFVAHAFGALSADVARTLQTAVRRFYGTIGACACSGSQALLRLREGLGTRLTVPCVCKVCYSLQVLSRLSDQGSMELSSAFVIAIGLVRAKYTS